MYGLKRVEFNDDKTVKALEFYQDVSGESIVKVLRQFGFMYGEDKHRPAEAITKWPTNFSEVMKKDE